MRVRHALREPARIMLLLHGWTGDETSMWVFTQKLPDEMWITAPRAPHPADNRGYSWRIMQPGTWGVPSLSDFKPAAKSLIQLMDEISPKINVDVTQFDVIGFSQGGALTNTLALLYPKRIRKAAVLAGFMPTGVDELLNKRVLSGKEFFIAHGSQDDLVPIKRAQQSIELLKKSGAKVTFCEAEVGHKVSADCLNGLEAFWDDR